MDNRKKIEDFLRDRHAVERASQAGIREALLRHKLLGESIVVWEDGKVVEIPAEEIVIDPPAPPANKSPAASSSDAA